MTILGLVCKYDLLLNVNHDREDGIDGTKEQFNKLIISRSMFMSCRLNETRQYKRVLVWCWLLNVIGLYSGDLIFPVWISFVYKLNIYQDATQIPEDLLPKSFTNRHYCRINNYNGTFALHFSQSYTLSVHSSVSPIVQD